MKYKIAWTSPIQGIQSTTLDAINTFAAQEQIKSMFAHIEGFRIISISPVFEKTEKRESESNYTSNQSSRSSSSDGFDSLSSSIGGLALMAGVVMALFGLFTLPAGIIAMVIGGAVGFFGWKMACWLDDRGW